MHISSSELTLGKFLGEGAFCEVKEISAINLNNNNKDTEVEDEGRQATTPPADLTYVHEDDTDEADFPINLLQSKDSRRGAKMHRSIILNQTWWCSCRMSG